MATVSVEYYGISGTGRNVTEAKRDAGRKLERLAKNYRPTIYSWRGYSVVVYRNPQGSSYSLIHPDSEGEVYSVSSGGEFADHCESAIRHLLSCGRAIGEYDVPSWVPASIDRKSLISDWKSHDGFQLAYRYAETLSADELGGQHIHNWACDHSREFIPRAEAIAS